MTVLVYLMSTSLECYSLSMDLIIKKSKPETETGAWNCSVKKAFLKITQSSQKTTCSELLFKKVADLQIAAFSKEAPAQVVFSEFCKIFMRIHFAEYVQTTASS